MGKKTNDLTDKVLKDLNQDVEETSAGELLDDAMQNSGETLGLFKKITDNIDFGTIWDGVLETNKDASMDVLGGKVSHVIVTVIHETAKGLVPEDSEFGRVLRSKIADAIMYGILSQGIVVIAGSLVPVHPKFSFIAQGAARNSIKRTAGAFNLANTLFSQTHPLLKKFFM